MMKRLNSVDILGLLYKVVHSKKKIVEDGTTCVGLHSPYPKEITLWIGLEKDEWFQTLIHEALHPIDFKLDLNLGERKVKLLSVAITDFLIRNRIVKL